MRGYQGRSQEEKMINRARSWNLGEKPLKPSVGWQSGAALPLAFSYPEGAMVSTTQWKSIASRLTADSESVATDAAGLRKPLRAADAVTGRAIYRRGRRRGHPAKKGWRAHTGWYSASANGIIVAGGP